MEPFEHPQLCKKRKGTDAEVITIDDEEPVPPPSAEVIELREMLAKTEDMYRRAMRVASEAEKRAQMAEDQLASKLVVLGKSVKLTDSLDKYKDVLLCENGQQRSDLYETKNSLEAAINAKEELTRQNNALKAENHRLKEIEKEHTFFAQQHMRDRATIDDLRRKLGMLAKAAAQQQQQQQQQQQLTTPQRSTVSVKPPAATATISPLSSSSTSEESVDVALPDSPDSPEPEEGDARTKVHDINDPTNLFRLCAPHEPWMAPIAVTAHLRDIYKSGMVQKWQVHCSKSDESYACGVCKVEVRKVDVFEHFLSKHHYILVAHERIAQATLHYWKDQLQLASGIDMSTALAATGHKMLPSVAAQAAAAAAAARATAVARMNEEANDDANSSGSAEI